MALPIANSPIYSLKIPSTKKEVKYRPFLVKEQTALLLAEQSEDFTIMINTIKSVISSCTFDKLDVDTLALFDIEYIMLQLRSRSVGELESLNVPCESCNKINTIGIDFSSIDVTYPEGHTNRIELFDDVGMVMKYPGLNLLNKISDDMDMTVMTELIIGSIDYIYDSDKMYPAKENQEELSSFIENLPVDSFLKIEQFFKTIPYIRETIEFQCECGHHNKRVIEGLESFFR